MIVLIQCSDQKALVATITKILADFDFNVTSLREFVDTENDNFYAKFECDGTADFDLVKQELISVLPENAQVTINPNPDKKLAVLVTKEYHCLSDILIRNHIKTLSATVACVVGNHPDLEDLCKRFDIPFHFISHENKSKEIFENEVKNVLDMYKLDYLILAKFMRILSPWFVLQFPHKIINIHHSFLPAFIGANPYKKAYERGVKLIGATAHFVTDDLDEGPIIVQQTISVNHTYSAKDMVRAGKDIETAVLAKAIDLVMKDKVFVNGNKTIIFKN